MTEGNSSGISCVRTAWRGPFAATEWNEWAAVGSGWVGDARWSARLGPRRRCHLHATRCRLVWFRFSSGKWAVKDAAEANRTSLESMPVQKTRTRSGWSMSLRVWPLIIWNGGGWMAANSSRVKSAERALAVCICLCFCFFSMDLCLLVIEPSGATAEKGFAGGRAVD